MTLTLSDCYWEGKTLLSKYPEPWKDSHHGDKFDFYAWDYWPHVIHTEEARILPIIWNNINVLISEWVLDPALIQYYNDIYPNTFSDKKIIPYNNTDYYSYIKNQVRNKSLITLHPYQNINEEKYALDPNLVFDLNDKTNMYKLTNQIPKHEILKLDQIRCLENFPFVLKADSWASWDWVRIIKNKEDLNKALKWFSKEDTLMVEEYIEYIDNVWVQLFISQIWTINILWYSKQIVSEQWEYEWSIINKNYSISSELRKLAIGIWTNAYKMWFYWICWLDFLKDRNQKYFLIDPNFRITWATSLIFLQEKIFAESNANCMQVQQFKSNHPNIQTMVSENISLNSNQLYLLSSYKDRVSGIISWFSIITWESEEHINYNKEHIYKKKWFTI